MSVFHFPHSLASFKAQEILYIKVTDNTKGFFLLSPSDHCFPLRLADIQEHSASRAVLTFQFHKPSKKLKSKIDLATEFLLTPTGKRCIKWAGPEIFHGQERPLFLCTKP